MKTITIFLTLLLAGCGTMTGAVQLNCGDDETPSLELNAWCLEKKPPKTETD